MWLLTTIVQNTDLKSNVDKISCNKQVNVEIKKN